MAAHGTSKSKVIRARLSHPVIDSDGHWREYEPLAMDYLRDVGGPKLVMHVHGDTVWLNDDGKEEGDKDSRILSIDRQGKVSVLIDANPMLPISAGFDIAPDGFGKFGGQIFALSRPKIGDKGGPENYVVQRIDPWVSDINGDFIYGKHELPDGFIVEITP